MPGRYSSVREWAWAWDFSLHSSPRQRRTRLKPHPTSPANRLKLSGPFPPELDGKAAGHAPPSGRFRPEAHFRSAISCSKGREPFSAPELLVQLDGLGQGAEFAVPLERQIYEGGDEIGI